MTTTISNYLTYEEWLEKYDIKQNEYGDLASFETYGKDWDYIATLDPHYVWTFRSDGDDDCITNGVGIVNRLEYYVSKKPWRDGEYIEVRW